METITQLSFEEALTELERTVEKLEGEMLSLDEMVQLYQRGRQLAEYCQQLLEKAELRVRRLTEGEETDLE